MHLYTFDINTGVYVGQRMAQVDPLETKARGQTVYMQPGRNATTVIPPAVGPKQAARWTGAAWEVVPDHRGETWWRDWQTPVVIDMLGPPRGVEPLKPPAPFDIVREQAWSEIKGALLIKRLEINDGRGEAHELKGALALNASDDTIPTERDAARKLLDAYASTRGESGWEETAAKIIAARNRWSQRVMGLEMLEDGTWRALQGATTAEQVAGIAAQVLEAIKGV